MGYYDRNLFGGARMAETTGGGSPESRTRNERMEGSSPFFEQSDIQNRASRLLAQTVVFGISGRAKDHERLRVVA
jgi:hypothetical protein